jgi:murein DD-endopeptidase MepM/ murein hydrolase activator NlpD
MPANAPHKKTLLIVSPGGKPVQRVPISFFAVVALLLFVFFGIASFFIPPEVFRLKSTEEFQKKELKSQNEMLYRRFFSALQMLSHVREQINLLDTKKDKVASLTGFGNDERTPSAPAYRLVSTAAHTEQDLAALIARLNRQDSVVAAFEANQGDGRNPFECIPVCKPVPRGGEISRHFGKNIDPFTGQERPHFGIDLAAPPGASVIATASGTISRIENSSVWGKRITIDHGNGISTVYAHLGSITATSGRRVKRGDVIGAIGCSGLTTGPHVHYEIWKNGTAVDPEGCFFP